MRRTTPAIEQEPSCKPSMSALRCDIASTHSAWHHRTARSRWRLVLRGSRLDPRPTEAFALVANRLNVRDAWIGLAAAHDALGHQDLAADSLRALLSRHGHVRGMPTLLLHDARWSGPVIGWGGLAACQSCRRMSQGASSAWQSTRRVRTYTASGWRSRMRVITALCSDSPSPSGVDLVGRSV